MNPSDMILAAIWALAAHNDGQSWRFIAIMAAIIVFGAPPLRRWFKRRFQNRSIGR